MLIRYPVLEPCKASIVTAFELLKQTYAVGGKLLVCGNGGSAADAEHIVGELMKGFKNPRKLDDEYQRKLKNIDNNNAIKAISIGIRNLIKTFFLEIK